jgi:hypothetical protein
MSTSNDCNCDDPGPEFVLNPAIGTTPCDINGATSTSPCDPDACCSFFRTCEADGSNNFIFSAGGSFQFDPLTRRVQSTPSGGFVGAGPLDGIVCVPNLPPGTYKIEVRADLLPGTPSEFVAVVFPDCEDDSIAYAVVTATNSGSSIMSVSGFLYFFNSGCAPGFELFGCSGFQNLQVTITKLSGRQIVDCNGSDLLTTDTSEIGTPCSG